MPSFIPSFSARVPVVLVPPTLLKYASAWRAAALAIPDVGVAVFFIAGVATSGAGIVAPWFAAAAVLLGLACRTLDVEGWGLRITGGLPGRAGTAFGPRAAAAAAASQLLERVLFAGLAALVCGHYLTALPVWLFVPAALRPTRLSAEDPASVCAMFLIGFAWTRARLGYTSDTTRVVRRTWTAVAVVFAVMLWAVAAVAATPSAWKTLSLMPAWEAFRNPPTTLLGSVFALLFAFGQTLPAIGSGDSLARAATELEPPRIRGVWRTLTILTAYGGFVTVASTFLFSSLVPADVQQAWTDIPVLGIARHLPGPPWAGTLITVAVGVSATLLLGQAVRAGLSGAERMLAQLGQQGRISHRLTMPHAHFGTLARAVDTSAGAAAVAVVISAGRVEWLAHAYAACLAWTLLLKVMVLAKLRRPIEEAPFRVPLTLTFRSRQWPVGLAVIGLVVAATWAAMVVGGDAPTIAASVALLGVALVFGLAADQLPDQPAEDDPLRLV